MKFLHTSDWHIGRTLHGEDLTEPFIAFLDFLVEVVEQKSVSVVLISGDLFDRSIPSLASLELATQALERLTALVPVVISSGNHDSAERLGLFAPYLNDRLFLATGKESFTRPIVFSQADEIVQVWALPYLYPDQWRYSLAVTPDGSPDPLAFQTEEGDFCLPRSHTAVLGAALRRIIASENWAQTGSTQIVRIADQKVASTPTDTVPDRDYTTGRSKDEEAVTARILMAHTFLASGIASDSERDIAVGGVAAVAPEVLTTWGQSSSPPPAPDYVALGHLHRPQWVTSTGSVVAGDTAAESSPAAASCSHPDSPLSPSGVPLRYSGSPLAFSFSEGNYQKSVSIFDTTTKETQIVAIPVWRRLSRIRDRFEALLDPKNYQEVAADWLEITVLAEQPPEQMVSQLKLRFPAALQIRWEPVGFAAVALEDLDSFTVQHRPVDTCQSFYREMTGENLSEAEKDLLEQIIGRSGENK